MTTNALLIAFDIEHGRQRASSRKGGNL